MGTYQTDFYSDCLEEPFGEVLRLKDKVRCAVENSMQPELIDAQT